MKKTHSLLPPFFAWHAGAAYAQAASGNAMMKGSAPSSGNAMAAQPATDAAAKPKKMAAHHVSKKEAAADAQEAEVTKQLNMQEASYASGAMK